jgi:hypothetical protein
MKDPVDVMILAMWAIGGTMLGIYLLRRKMSTAQYQNNRSVVAGVRG